MSAAVLPEMNDGLLASEFGREQKMEFWGAMMKHIARGVTAYHSVEKYTRLAQSYANQRHPSDATTTAAQQATAQALLHKEAFDACVSGLVEINPNGLLPNPPSAPASSPLLDSRVTSLEDRVSQIDGRAEPQDRWLNLLDQSVTRIEGSVKAIEEDYTRAITQVNRSHKQLEGRVNSLCARSSDNHSPDTRTSSTTIDPKNLKQAENVETILKDVKLEYAKFEERMQTIEKSQSNLQNIAGNFENLECGLRVTQLGMGDIQTKIESLEPLVTKANTAMSVVARVKDFDKDITELQNKYETLKSRSDLTNEMSKAIEQKVEELKSKELKTLSDNVAVLLPLKQYINFLAILPDIIQGVRKSVIELAPVGALANGLAPISAASDSLLALIPKQEQTARLLQQLESDVTSCLDSISQLQSRPNALDGKAGAAGVPEEKMHMTPEMLRSLENIVVSHIRPLTQQVEAAVSSNKHTLDSINQVKQKCVNLETSMVNVQRNIGPLLVLNDKTSALIALPAAVEDLRTALRSYVPIKAWIGDLRKLAGQSAFLLGLPGQFNGISQDYAQLQTIKERQNKAEITSSSMQIKLDELYTGVYKLNAMCKLNRDMAEAVGPLRQQITEIHSLNENMSNEFAAFKKNIVQLKDSVSGIDAKSKAAQITLQHAQEEIKSMQGQILATKPLVERTPALVILSSKAGPLLGLLNQFAELSRQTEESVRQNLANHKSENAVLFRQYSQSHEKIKKLIEELQGNMIVEEQRMEQLETQATQLRTEVKQSSEHIGNSQTPLTKVVKEAQDRLVKVTQHAQRLEGQLGQLQKDQTVAFGDITMLQTFTKTAETQLSSLKPLVGHCDSLVHLADRKPQLCSLARDFEQVHDKPGHELNFFLAYHTMRIEVNSFQSRLEKINALDDRLVAVESTALEANKLRSLIAQVESVEQKIIALPSQFVRLENMESMNQQMTKFESQGQVSQGKLSSAMKAWFTQMSDLSGKIDANVELTNNVKKSVEDILALKPHVAPLTTLSENAEQVLSLHKQTIETNVGVSKLFAAHEKSTRRYGELTDSLGLLRRDINEIERKVTATEIGLETLGAQFKDCKAIWDPKLQAIKAENNKRLPAEQHDNVIVTPLTSPTSPVQRSLEPTDSRIVKLEHKADSATRELKNMSNFITRMDIKLRDLKQHLAGVDIRLTEFSTSNHSGCEPLVPLTEHVQALVTLAVEGEAPSHTTGEARTLAIVVRQVSLLDTEIKDLASRVPSIEQLELFTNQVEAISPHLSTVEKLRPLSENLESTLLLAGQAEALSALPKQAETLTSLVQRVERIEKLLYKVNKLLPLASQAAELQASLKHGSEPQLPVVESSPSSQTSTPGQLHSPSTERHKPPLPFNSIALTPFVPSSTIPSGHSSKKRKLEDAVGILEEQLDSMRSEVDNVVWNVNDLEGQLAGRKRLHMGLEAHGQGNSGAVQDSSAWREKVENDLDTVLNVISQLWKGEGGWPARLEAALERSLDRSLKVQTADGETEGRAILGLVDALRSDVDILRMVVESRGPGMVVSPSVSTSAPIDQLIEGVLERVRGEQASFTVELEAWLERKLQPLKDVARALKGMSM